MAAPFNRCIESTTSTGTGALTLLGALTGHRAVGSKLTSPTDTGTFTIWGVDANGNATGEWEISICTYSAANTLTRPTVPLDSSNGGALVNFSAGTKYVALSIEASEHVTLGRSRASAQGAMSI